ncbi:DUF2157 domain-containing protein [Bacillus sp. DJP31]|uniref:DUF2157 domain-containing protein n=1 Tax=Bacillus sp. DJP31 TaxID=3409789 RepID=UPI003BB6D146
MRKKLVQEGTKWVKDGIISEEQYEQILSRYQHEKSSNLLPILASILIGLGILSFVASNWDGIHHLVRVAIIILSMSGFYFAGERVMKKSGHDRLGHGLIGIGVITFGAGIFLLGQMFSFQSHSALPFIFWSIAALLAVQFWKSRYLLLLAIVITTAGQLYSTTEFSSFSYILALLLLFGIGHFIFYRPDVLTSVFFSLSFLLTGLLFVVSNELNYQYLFAIYLGLYVLSDFIKKVKIKRIIQLTMLIGAVVVTIFNVFWIESFISYGEEAYTNGLTIYPFIVAVLLVLFVIRKRGTFDVADGVLFLPVFYVGVMVDFLYLLLLFVYSISLLLIGYREHLTDKASLGTALFLISAFVGYIQLAWDFMPKSMFFLIGGIVLFVLSWFLEKSRRKLVKGVAKND